MGKCLVMLMAAAVLAGCATKNVSAHSDVLEWDIPNSLAAEGIDAQQTLQALAETYQLACGPNEAFDLMDRARFDREFERFLITQGYRRERVMREGDAELFALTGPKPLLATLSPQRFTVCEVRPL